MLLGDFLLVMELLSRFELPTSSLPRMRSTAELQERFRMFKVKGVANVYRQAEAENINLIPSVKKKLWFL